ncbi:MAG: hypothetical protein GY822_21975 [Deltaproteobacteria bacterium]|nr:hypothetical protein [Deltaproteobacteria bacterium]
MKVDTPASPDEVQSRLSRWLDGFLPNESGDADARRRGRVTIRAIMAILFVAPLLVTVHLFAGRPDNAAIVAGMGLIGVFSLYVLKYSQPFASHWILFCTHGLTILAAFGAGGVRAPMMVWGTLTPPVAVMLLSKRAAWGWWFVWSLEVLALGLAENRGWVPELLLPRTDALYSVNALIASTFVITLFSLSYEKQKDRMLIEEARARRPQSDTTHHETDSSRIFLMS